VCVWMMVIVLLSDDAPATSLHEYAVTQQPDRA
jgi:hypothetical protein